MIKRFTAAALTVILCLVLVFEIVGCSAPCEHTYGSTYAKNADGHWQICSKCNAKNQVQAHTDNPCTVCGYDITNPPAPSVSKIRDLKAFIYAHDYFSYAKPFIYVELPDGKNLLIDSGSSNTFDVSYLKNEIADYYTAVYDEIDYYIQTNALDEFCGGISKIIDEPDANEKTLVVKDAYIPDVTDAYFPVSQNYVDAKNALLSISGCTIHTLTQTTITNKFSYNGVEYEYVIDIMTPVTLAECNDGVDEHGINYQAYVSVEYMGKTILYTGMASKINVDNFINYNYNKDVNVLITITHNINYEFDALANSGSAGRTEKSFFEVTNMGEGDYCILGDNGNIYMGDLLEKFFFYDVSIYGLYGIEQPKIVTTITNTGALTISEKHLYQN